MKKKLSEILDRLSNHNNVLGFVADHVEDVQASMSICAVQDDLKKTMKQIRKLQQR